MTPESLNTLATVLSFLERLNGQSIHYSIDSVRPGGLMVTVAVPGERWEIEFSDEAPVEVEIFTSDGMIFDSAKLDELLSRFAD